MPAQLPVIDIRDTLCCEPLGSPQWEPGEDAVQVALRLRVLADVARLTIVQLLARQPGHALATSELAPLVKLSEATVSHHLKQLTSAGMVSKHRDGQRVLYQLDLESINAIAQALNITCHVNQNCC